MSGYNPNLNQNQMMMNNQQDYSNTLNNLDGGVSMNMPGGLGIADSPPQVNQYGFGQENQNPNFQSPVRNPAQDPNNMQPPQSDRKSQVSLDNTKLNANEGPEIIVRNERSNLFTNNDRFVIEQQSMNPLKAGGGLMGTSLITLDEKVNLLNLEKSKTLTNDQMLEKLRIDGVYVRDPQVHQKFTDINVQKLEERILREMPYVQKIEKGFFLPGPEGQRSTQYFKMNGEIKLHNDLLADEITRPSDLAFETTEAYQTKEVNSILCNRLHSFKRRYYRLDIVIGKICLLKYPQFFCLEDILAIELRELYKEYERRTSLAMIPFYQERLKFIEEEQMRKQRNPHSTMEELDFLRSNVEETRRKLDQEKREVQDMAQKLYQKWTEIKNERKKNGYSSTNVKMKIHKSQQMNTVGDNIIGDQNGEFYFNLMHEEPSGLKNGKEALPYSEVSRRNSAMRVRAYIRLIINGRYVSRTRKAFVKWPQFEIEIGEQFQVCVFTMPSSIQLELVIGTFKEQLVDVIDVEVPGTYVKALTSAAQLIKEVPFSKLSFDKKRMKLGSNLDSITHNTKAMTEKERIKFEELKKKKDELEKKAFETDINGVMYIKAEWKGEGPEMPPMRSENLFKMRKAEKVRIPYTLEQQDRMLLRQLYIDVNDPRNERIIRFLKEFRNETLQKLLLEDSKNPLFQLTSFRHMLLEARAKDPELAKTIIPLLEKEIIENPILLDKLEVLNREKAYRAYLEKKAQEEKLENANNRDDSRRVFILENEENALQYDAECIRRRQIFFDLQKQYQREIKAGHQKASTQYKSVVREFELLESENPLVALFNKLFITSRKLRPVVQKRQPVALDSCKEAQIMIHIIKGFNVPIRNSAKQKIVSTFQNSGQGGDGNFRGTGPYPSSNQYDRTQMMMQGAQGNFMSNMGMNSMGMGNMGMSNQFDNRSSFGQRQSMGMGQFGNNMPMQSMGNQVLQRMGGNVPLNQNDFNQPMRNVNGQNIDLRNLNEMTKRSVYRTQRVESFVEVRVVYPDGYERSEITLIAEGDFPEWNEILQFPLQSRKGKFTKQELVNTSIMIYVTLLDREIDVAQSDKIEIQFSYRYLGSFSIPLISVLNNPPKIDAIFKVNRPLGLFNYHVEPNSFFFLNQGDNKVSEKQAIPNTYISMSVSLDPVLELPIDNLLEYYPGKESPSLLIALIEWAKDLKKKKSFERRHIKCLGENINGFSVLLCRYLTDQAPPEVIFKMQNVSNNATDNFEIERAARYVSLIPVIEDNQAFTEMPDLFCTSQEFLDLGAGDYEEHAILLCNYFNYIDKAYRRENVKSYLVLGTGFPEGRTAYVMRRDTTTNHVELWNPIKGEAYFYGRTELKEFYGCIPVSKGFKNNKSPNDAICQLRSVGCIISQDNIWANVQQYEDPSLLDFNLDNTKCWKPFFTKSNFKKYFPLEKIQTIQPDPIQYMERMNEKRVEVISQKVKNYICEKFENERISSKKKMRTRWNNSMESTLDDILKILEIKKQSTRLGASNSDVGQLKIKDKIDDLAAKIGNVQSEIEKNALGFKIWGFPINVTFISLPLLWEEVKNTKIHLIEDDEAEFSIQVYIQSYPHNVLSVWFFILALTKNK